MWQESSATETTSYEAATATTKRDGPTSVPLLLCEATHRTDESFSEEEQQPPHSAVSRGTSTAQHDKQCRVTNTPACRNSSRIRPTDWFWAMAKKESRFGWPM